jgi:hypothetical protein
MNTLAVELHPQALNVTCTDIAIVVDLVDGRTISVPLIWFPRLSCANQKQLNNWELLGDGEGIYWPDLDKDLSVAGLLSGTHLKNSIVDKPLKFKSAISSPLISCY